MLQEPERVFARGLPLRHVDPADLRARRHELEPVRRSVHGLPPEFAALERAGLAPGPLYAALSEAERMGVAPFDALANSGAFDGDDLVATLARALGVECAGPDASEGPAIDAEVFRAAMTSGRLCTRDRRGRPLTIVAARGDGVGRLAQLRRGQSRDPTIAIASPRAFADIVTARAARALGARAAEGPARLVPELTVAHGLPRVGRVGRGMLIVAALALAGLISAFDAVAVAALTLIGLLFLTLNMFRLVLVATPDCAPRRSARSPDVELPVYTVLVALYREAAVIPSLLDALENLDYPAAKLDIKILTERNDTETRRALIQRPPRFGIEVLTLPPGEPQTKPRALNAGLAAARGNLLTVFDAEDRPEPNQLRVAVEAFRRGAAELGCVQARLAIDNIADGWLSRHFAIEYAALFDVTLPALSARGLPIPLGGTSNHFRVEALEAVGGWDAGNVTEDADLGLRLARLGWKTETIASVTWEEAPATFPVWFRQRTRWMKGFMVTALVHGRRPSGLLASLGPLPFLASQLLIAGVALTALAYPLVSVLFVWHGLSGALLAPTSSLTAGLFTGFHVANLIVGFAAGLGTASLGVDRRYPAQPAIDLCTLPAYWFLVGLAAWRALWQIASARTTDWEKTPHGLSTRRATPPHT